MNKDFPRTGAYFPFARTDVGRGMVCFLLTGGPSAQLPLRVLGLFAQRDILVDRFVLSRCGDGCRISVTVSALPAATADIMLEKLRALVEVASAVAGTDDGDG